MNKSLPDYARVLCSSLADVFDRPARRDHRPLHKVGSASPAEFAIPSACKRGFEGSKRSSLLRAMRAVRGALCLATIGTMVTASLFGGRLQAAEQPTATSEVPAADLKELNDPTILTRRIWLETEWNRFQDGTNIIEETLGTLWSWRVSDHQDWAVRLKLPVKMRFDSNVADVPDIEGLGDIKIATGTAWRLTKTFRIGLGVDLQMPTGREELSDNNWRLQEFLAVGWDITPWLTFSPSFEYNQSLAVEGSTAQTHFLESYFPLTFILPHKWAISVGYENKADFENDNYVTHRAKLQFSKELENVPLSFALSGKREFDSGEKEYQINFVISYFFR